MRNWFQAFAFSHATCTAYVEATIVKRREDVIKEGDKPSWTRRLLDNPKLLCEKVREEAGELCETLEKDEVGQAGTSF